MLSDKLKSILNQRYMSIHKLAVLSGVPYSTIYSIIKRDTEKVDPKIISKIAKALGIDESVLHDDVIIRNASTPEELARLRLDETIQNCAKGENKLLYLVAINSLIKSNRAFLDAMVYKYANEEHENEYFEMREDEYKEELSAFMEAKERSVENVKSADA